MTDFVDLATYKGYKGITGSGDDAKLGALIPGVTQLIKTYCGRSFLDYYAVDKIEQFTLKWYQNVVFLKEIPIVSVTSVEELTDGSQTSYDTLTSSQYLVDAKMDAIYRIESEVRKNFPIGVNAVKVTYKGGYAEIPEDLKLAASDLITYYLKEQYLPEKSHSSFTIRYNSEKPDFPEHIKRVLDAYKDV